MTARSAEPDVTAEVTDGVAVVRLNRPEQRNAFTRTMGRLIGEHYRAFDADPAVRVIVVTGAVRDGVPPAFCAGADFSGGADVFAAPTDAAFSASPVKPPAFDLRKPVIAALNGHAIGIGFTIAMQADLRVVADEAKYSIAEVRRGVVPDALSHWTVPHAAGSAVAAEVLLTGRTFDGPEAMRLGLANRSVPAADVLDTAMEWARDIAVNTSPLSVALSKRLLWDVLRNGFTPEQVDDFETELHHRTMGTPDSVEGVAAFVERRDPCWQSRVPTDWSPLSWQSAR